MLAMMLAFTLVLAFCMMAATLVDRQWIHVSKVCWYNPRTSQSLFYPYYGLHDSQQLRHGHALTPAWCIVIFDRTFCAFCPILQLNEACIRLCANC